MKTRILRRQLTLMAVALATAFVLPAGAARFRTVSVVRLAVFQVASNARIVVGTDSLATLSNLNVGDRVSIAYDHENGALVAHHIADGVAPKSGKTMNLSTRAVHHHATTSTYEHIHGIIRSVDVQNGTLTILFRERL